MRRRFCVIRPHSSIPLQEPDVLPEEAEDLVFAPDTGEHRLSVPLAQFLYRLKIKGFRDRTVGLMENGSWGPTALRTMLAELEGMKGLNVVEPKITIKSAATDANRTDMRLLAKAMAEAI